MPSKLLFLLLCSALLAAPAQTPQFRATVELATVDFRAMSGGRPVTDLKQDEVLLKIDGRVRALQQLVFAGTEDVASSDPASTTRLPPSFWTNRARDAGRAFFLYFDDQNIGPGNEGLSRDAALRFLDRLGVYDRVAVITSAGTQVALTTDRARTRAALGAVTSHARTPITQGGRPLAGLDGFLSSIAPIDGPKNVVLISEGLRSNPINKTAPDVQEFRDLSRTAFRARAQIYLIRPVSIGRSDLDSDVNFEWLADAVGAAGGDVFAPSGQVDVVFARIERESAGSYTLGFSPTNDESDGKLHRVEIAVRRQGVEVIARSQFLFAKRPSGAAKPVTAMTMLQELSPRRELELRGAAYIAAPAEKAGVKVLIVFETTSGEPLREAGLAVFDPRTGKAHSIWPLTPKEIADARVTSGVLLAPGSYRARASGISSTGMPGSLEFDFTAPALATAAATTSDLMIGQNRPDGSFDPRVGVGSESRATGFLIFTGEAGAGPSLSATFDVARTPEGPALVSAAGRIANGDTPTLWTARGTVPVDALPPGDYLLRCRVTRDGKPLIETIRAFRRD